MSPIDMMKAIKNPKQFVMNSLGQNMNNPMMNNLVKMAQNGNKTDVETFARNLFKENGRDFDKEFSNFMNEIKK